MTEVDGIFSRNSITRYIAYNLNQFADREQGLTQQIIEGLCQEIRQQCRDFIDLAKVTSKGRSPLILDTTLSRLLTYVGFKKVPVTTLPHSH
jgi:hypothetical protein